MPNKKFVHHNAPMVYPSVKVQLNSYLRCLLWILSFLCCSFASWALAVNDNVKGIATDVFVISIWPLTKGWFNIWFHVIRFEGFFCNKPCRTHSNLNYFTVTGQYIFITFKNDIQSGDKKVGHLICSVLIFLIKCNIELVQKGGLPISSSYIMHPNDQRSAL